MVAIHIDIMLHQQRHYINKHKLKAAAAASWPVRSEQLFHSSAHYSKHLESNRLEITHTIPTENRYFDGIEAEMASFRKRNSFKVALMHAIENWSGIRKTF